ncbi:MAG: serine hydrolase, partial [Pseudomonadota bacterium]
PRAMATLTHRLLFGDALSAASRGILRDWMLATTTGKRRLTAGFDPAWRIGHKTGTGIAPGIANKYNDVAVAWRDGHEPLVIAAYFEADGAYPRIRPEDERVLARVASIVSQQR